jgi:predicted nucleic acid-binding protein
LIILDTNVLSAVMQPAPDPQVVAWLDRQPSDSIWLTAVTVFEARVGLALLPASKRKSALELSFVLLLRDDLEHRVLEFDAAAAVAAATLAAKRQQEGRAHGVRDTEIAGIALSRRAAIATRNVSHFDDLNIPVVNPWTVTSA